MREQFARPKSMDEDGVDCQRRCKKQYVYHQTVLFHLDHRFRRAQQEI